MNLSHYLKKYCERFPDEVERLAPLLKQSQSDSNITDRKTLPGHITASALVIDGEKILLIHHPFLKKWIQPGGHVDAGETPLEAAQRELLEETGMSVDLHPWHEKFEDESQSGKRGNDTKTSTSTRSSNYGEAIPFDIDIHLIPANEKKDEPGHLHYDFRFLFSVDKSESIKNHEDHVSRWVKFHEAEELQVLIEKIKKYRVE